MGGGICGWMVKGVGGVMLGEGLQVGSGVVMGVAGGRGGS